MAREFAKTFYSSKAWQTCRNEYAKRVGLLCENCLRQGIYKPGVIVHHKIELDPVNIENPEISLNFENLELLCRDCHAKIHDLSGGRWSKVNEARKTKKLAENRYFVDENGRVTAKDSPPGADS